MPLSVTDRSIARRVSMSPRDGKDDTKLPEPSSPIRPSSRSPSLKRVRLAIACFLVLWATLLVLGSWYPFRFEVSSFERALAEWWRGVRLIGQSRSDLAINVIAGIPLGFCAGLLMFNRPHGNTVPV